MSLHPESWIAYRTEDFENLPKENGGWQWKVDVEVEGLGKIPWFREKVERSLFQYTGHPKQKKCKKIEVEIKIPIQKNGVLMKSFYPMPGVYVGGRQAFLQEDGYFLRVNTHFGRWEITKELDPDCDLLCKSVYFCSVSSYSLCPADPLEITQAATATKLMWSSRNTPGLTVVLTCQEHKYQ